jgi:hypothetical protein
VERLRTSPSPDAPKTNAPKPVPYDEMILRLLETIANEALERAGSGQGKLESILVERLDFHVNKLGEVTEERRKERDDLLKEKAKHITSDDIHDGFSSKVECSLALTSSTQFTHKSYPVCSCKARTSPGHWKGKGSEFHQDHHYRGTQSRSLLTCAT